MTPAQKPPETSLSKKRNKSSRRPPKKIIIDSQNIRSSSGDGYDGDHGKLKEIARQMSTQDIYATLLQETWLPPTRLEIKHDGKNYQLVSAGHGKNQNKRKGGVGIILSPRAHKAWLEKKGWMRQFGPNIIALKLNIRTGPKKHRGRHSKLLYLVSGYSPSNPDRKTDDMRKYLRNLQACLKQCENSKYILIMGTDANISFGTNRDRASNWPKTTGKHGIQATGKYQKKAATELQGILACHKLC